MKIPKKIHLVWFGGERPMKFQPLVDMIKDVNYDYEVLEWNDNNIDFELINASLFNECTNLGAKSDIFRFEVLYKHGGIYMDYDFVQIKKFDDLLDYDFFAGSDENSSHETWNSILGSTKENEVCENFLKGLSDTKPIEKYQIDRVMNETGPYYLHKILTKHTYNLNIKRFVGKYFFPFPAVERFKVKNLTPSDIEYAKQYINEKTYCIHLHTTSWQ